MKVPSHPDNRLIVGLLTSAVRLRNSRNGNARWELGVAGHRYHTKLDTQLAASMDPTVHIGDAFIIEVNIHDEIVDMAQLEPAFVKRCPVCDVTFTREDDYHNHNSFIHHVVTRPREK